VQLHAGKSFRQGFELIQASITVIQGEKALTTGLKQFRGCSGYLLLSKRPKRSVGKEFASNRKMDKLHSDQTGHPAGWPVNLPDAFLYMGKSGDGEDCLTTFDRGTIVMSRPVAGLACRIRIPVRQYEAVAVLVRERRHVIRLLHRDGALSVDVEEFEKLETAEEYCDRLAGFLDLPPMIMAGARAAEGFGSEKPRRRRSHGMLRRRPRFLMRRRGGSAKPQARIEGRELIARS
jgi:hypothetical protein